VDGGDDHGLLDQGEAIVLERLVSRLQRENEQLRDNRARRAVIEQAKGVLMVRFGIPPEEAFAQLRAFSQHSNRKLANVAASLVAGTGGPTFLEPLTAGPRRVGGTDDVGAADQPGPGGREGGGTGTSATGRRGAAGRSVGGSPERQAVLRMTLSALATAEDLDDLLDAVLDDLAAVGVEAGSFAACEPDGALRLIVTRGFPQQVVSEWHRIPPALDSPLIAAVTSHAPVLLRDRTEREQRFTIPPVLPDSFEAQASLPLVHQGRALGVLNLAWPRPIDFSVELRRLLAVVAQHSADRFVELVADDSAQLAPPTVDATRSRWLRAALDAVGVPIVLLDPVREGAEVVDLSLAFANAALAEVIGGMSEWRRGQRILELYPGAVRHGTFAAMREVLQTGQPVRMATARLLDAGDHAGQPALQLVDLSVSRLGDGLLVTWRNAEVPRT
jgi:PAS domain-containing protein